MSALTPSEQRQVRALVARLRPVVGGIIAGMQVMGCSEKGARRYVAGQLRQMIEELPEGEPAAKPAQLDLFGSEGVA